MGDGKRMTQAEKVAARGTIAQRMTLLKYELGELGLFRTMHALDEATRQLGWELAADITGDKRHIAAGERYERSRTRGRP